jgi:hypothetical protein
MPLQQLRNSEELALMNAGIEDREYVGVRERSDGLRLPLEASTPIRVGRDRVGRTLIATSRPSLVSRARYTSPIPPAPTIETIS